MNKELFGILSIALTGLGYVPYFRSIFKRQTKPHMFTWITWSVLNAIAFAGQFAEGAGAGAWSIGASLVFGMIVAGLSFFVGERNITRSDWISFGLSLSALPLWYITDDPLSSIILITIIDIAGGYPTYRKCYVDPYSENLLAWSIYTVRSTVVLFAVEHYSVATLLIPVAALLINGGIALEIALRRWALKRNAAIALSRTAGEGGPREAGG